MRKSILCVLALCLFAVSCSQSNVVVLSYSVSDVNGNAFQNVYIADTGTTTLPVLVKFFTGNTNDSVKVKFSNLPANVTISPDSFTVKPTATENVAFTAHNAALGTYQATIRSSSPTTIARSYNFNIIVIPANCASLFNGTLSGSNACTSGGFTYSSAASSTASGVLSINNFGGYGTNTNASVVFDCQNNTLSLTSQNIGNGITVSGSGTFTTSSMVINYTATNVPSGGNDACTVTYTK
jgi:hypothetical protein